MKQFYKLSLLTIALFIGITAKAQESPMSIGIKVGANLSNIGGDIDDTDAKFGYNFGITVDYGFTPNWYLQSGVEFTTKGYKLKHDILNQKTTSNAMYLQLPVHAAYKLPIVDGTNIVFHAGPYFAYGIGGKTKYEVAGTTIKKISTFGDTPRAKRFDFGLGGGVGVEFGAITADLGCDFGLVNISHTSTSVKNQNFYLSVGYKFF